MRKLKKKLIPCLCVVPVLVVLVCLEQDYLWTAQEQNLFLHTPLFFRQQMVASGGLLTWTACYLTQFFYYPLLGTALLGLLWMLLMRLLCRVFRLRDPWLALVPVACLLLTVVMPGYWVYYLKLPGALFCATLGTLVAVSMAGLYRLVAAPWWLRTLLIAVLAGVGYPLFGFYGLWGVVLMALLSWRTEGSRPVADSVVAVVAVVGVPLACYHTLFHETNIVNIYWTALPIFNHAGQACNVYYVPYLLLVLTVSLMVLPLPRLWWLRAAVLTLAVVGVAVGWYKDDNFHRELAMRRSMERQDWQAMLNTSAAVKGEPTRAICMMQNLALSRLGRQGEEMFRYPNGAARPHAPFSVRLIHTVGKALYLAYGVPNYCYRWCMEDGVEYGWTVEKLKLMVECSLLNGESEAAQHFLSLLKKTDFQKAWAQKYQAYLHDPQLMEKDAELNTIRHTIRKDNFLTADQSQMEQFLLEHFLTAETQEPLLQEQTLIATLQTKNIEQFWLRFYQYTELHREARVPRHYQEAACLFGRLQNLDISHMPFDREVVIDCQNFMNSVSRYRSQGKSASQIAPLVYEPFHATYFYDFYFNQYNYVEP